MSKELTKLLSAAKTANFHFAMAVKGTAVVGLQLSRKDITGLAKWKASVGGTGLVTGVCGPGTDGLSFHIAEDTEPVEPSKLKGFLREVAGRDLGPAFVLSSPLAGATLDGEPVLEALESTTGTTEEEQQVEALVSRHEALDAALAELWSSVEEALGQAKPPADKHKAVQALSTAIDKGEAALNSAGSALAKVTGDVIAEAATIEAGLQTAEKCKNIAKQALALIKAEQVKLGQRLDPLATSLGRDQARVKGWPAGEKRAAKLSEVMDKAYRDQGTARLTAAEAAASALEKHVPALRDEVEKELQRITDEAKAVSTRRAKAELSAMEDEAETMKTAHEDLLEAFSADSIVAAQEALAAYEAAVKQVETDATERVGLLDDAVKARDEARALLEQDLEALGEGEIATRIKSTLSELREEFVPLTAAIEENDAYETQTSIDEVVRLTAVARAQMAKNASLLEAISAAEERSAREAAAAKEAETERRRQEQHAEQQAVSRALEETRIWGEQAFGGGDRLARQIWNLALSSGSGGGRPGEIAGLKSFGADEAAAAFWRSVTPQRDRGLLRGLRYYPPKDEGIRSLARSGQISSTYCTDWGLPGARRTTQFIVHVNLA